MRVDAPDFAAENLASTKSPRLSIRIVFDVASIVATTDADMTNVPGDAMLGHLQNVSGISQSINPDEARATIGALNFDLVDLSEDFTASVRAQLQTNQQGLRGRTVELRLGYTSDYNDSVLLLTQQIRTAAFDQGIYRVSCSDVQRSVKENVFEPTVTNLRLSVTAADTTIPVVTTTGFATVFHGPSYSDAPGATVGYLRLEDEIIRYTGTTADSFTGCTRGVFNTLATEHEVESGASADRQPEVTEFIYLELPGPKLAYAVLTGDLAGDGQTLPANWHLGIDTALVSLAEFQAIGRDLWDTTDDSASFVLRLAGLEEQDAKQFLEEQVYQPLGLFSPVRADGSLGLRRMVSILANAPSVMTLNSDNFVQVGELRHDFESLLNRFVIDWNYDAIAERFTRRRRIVDQASIDIHGGAEIKKLEWRGLSGSRHTDTVLIQRADALRDRYAGPPLRLSGELLYSANVLEVGDVVRVQLDQVRDFTGASGPIDRSFEVQRIAVDQVTGRVDVDLFGSTQSASVLPPGAGTALPDGWYSSEGTELSTVVSIVAGVIQPATYTLTGGADATAAGSIFYYLGDLELADGAVLQIDDNVQIRVRGFFTINGDIDGIGRGLAGAVDDGIIGNPNPGISGYLGSTRGWGGLSNAPVSALFLSRYQAPFTAGLNTGVPFLQLDVAGGALVGLPADLRGTSGGIGGRIVDPPSSVRANGGTGGDSGAGLIIVSRGATLGASGSIDLSGGDGGLGQTTQIRSRQFRAGTGAPGGPGALLFVVDGDGPSLPALLAGFTAAYGAVPAAGSEPTGETFGGRLTWTQGTPEPLAGFDESIGGDISAAALRIQRIAPETAPEDDIAVVSPANFAVQTDATGTLHVLTNTPPGTNQITEYFASNTNDRANAIRVGSSATGYFAHTPDPNTVTYYWSRNRNVATNQISAFTPDTTTTTVQGVALAGGGGGADGLSIFVASVYQRAASQPATPPLDDGRFDFTTLTLIPPVGWSEQIPTSDGNPAWLSQGQFSIQGTTGLDDTVQWTTPSRVVEDGATGADGTLEEFVFQRNAQQPATPTGNGIPGGWFDNPPGGTEPLWFSRSTQELNGTLVGSWSAPRRLDGQAGTSAMNIGHRMNLLDEWFADNAQTSTLEGVTGWSVQAETAAPVYGTSFQSAASIQLNLFSERIPIDRNKKYRVSHWGRDAGTKTKRLAISFYDETGTLITSATSDATGWQLIATYHYPEATVGMTSDWQLFAFSFGVGSPRSIPSNAASVSIGALTNQGAGFATQWFHDFRLVEEGDPGIIENPIVDEVADGSQTYPAGTNPRIDGTALNAQVTYTPPRDANVAVTWNAEAQIDNLSAGVGSAESIIEVLVLVNGVTAFQKELSLEGYLDQDLRWANFSGTRTAYVPAGQEIDARLRVTRDASAGAAGAVPAQEIFWRDADIEIVPLNRVI